MLGDENAEVELPSHLDTRVLCVRQSGFAPKHGPAPSDVT